MELLQQSLFVPCGEHRLHVRHIQPGVAVHADPILMVHGAIENGHLLHRIRQGGWPVSWHGTAIRCMWRICGGEASTRPSPNGPVTASMS